MTVKIMVCSKCPTHVFQDKEYGSKVRVHNQIKNEHVSQQSWRCTVCGHEVTLNN